MSVLKLSNDTSVWQLEREKNQIHLGTRSLSCPNGVHLKNPIIHGNQIRMRNW